MGEKALIIEDNENNLELIRFILEAADFRTSAAMTGIDGIERALNDAPDFIILDIQLPDMNGMEVLRKIRAHPAGKHVPIIAMTSYAMAGDRERLLKAGCTSYIEKPIDPMLVVGQIKSVIKNSGE